MRPALLLTLLGLLTLVACGDGGPSGLAAVSTAHATAATGALSGDTYRAFFNSRMTENTDAVEGSLVAVPAADRVPLPAHSGRIALYSAADTPDGRDTSAFLLSYRRPDGAREVLIGDYITALGLTTDADTIGLYAIALAPMWTLAAPSHPFQLLDKGTSPWDSLTTFILQPPSGAAYAMQLDGAGAAGNVPYLVVETRWADGRERDMVAVNRMANSPQWEARPLQRDASAAAEAGVQRYKTYLNLSVEHPDVYLLAFDA